MDDRGRHIGITVSKYNVKYESRVLKPGILCYICNHYKTKYNMPKVSISHKGTTCIYGILSPTGKIYIGQTWDLYHRYKSGVSKSQRLLYRSYKKHGEEAHKLFIIIDFRGPFTQSDLDYWERYYIEAYKAEEYQLLNIREGGGNNGRLSEETKTLISYKSKKWKEANPDLVREIALKAASCNVGKKRSEQTKALQSKALKGKPKTKEHALAVSIAKRGKPSTFKGKTFSVETIKQMKVNRTGKGVKPIKQLLIGGEFVKVWASIQGAAAGTGINKGTIACCIRGVKSYNTAGGYCWEYANENDKNAYANRTRKPNSNGKTIIQSTIENTFIAEWASMNEAFNKTGVLRQDILKCCKGRRKSAGGFKWRYK